MSIQNDIAELVEKGVITPETADRIRDYYLRKRGSPQQRLIGVFGILGAILIGLGIILIIAHNWDELSRPVKTALAFLPLLIGQALGGFVLLKRYEHTAWRESSAALLFFAIGASISLISQIYHLPGDLSAFLLTWMLLALPLVYALNASVTSLLYLIGSTYYAGEAGYWSYPPSEPYVYWLLLGAILPHYYFLCRDKPVSNFTEFHHWLIPLSVILALGTVARQTEELMFVAYCSLFGLLYLIGTSGFFPLQPSRTNSYRTLGSLGTIGLLLLMSFDGSWQAIRDEDFSLPEVITSPEFLASLLLSLAAGGLLYQRVTNQPIRTINPLTPTFLLFIGIFVIGVYSPVSVVLVNLLVLALGALTIRKGVRQDHLGVLNYGLLIITALVVCRFFDTDLSFVLRGILFVGVGMGFFGFNYWMLQRRKTHE